MYIAEVERKSGFSRDSIRFYENCGLVSPPARGANNYRVYDSHVLTELAFVQKGKSLGFTLKEIKPAIEHLRNPPEHCLELVESLRAKSSEVERRIEADKILLEDLERTMQFLSL